MPRHRLHGLVVRTPLALAATHARNDDVDDVVIEVDRSARLDERELHGQGPLLAHADDAPAGRRHVLTGTSERWCLELRGAAHVYGGRATSSVVVHAADDLDDGLLAVLLAGPVLTTISLMRGRPLLHASAIDSPAGVVLIVGPSGRGKSTVARLMVDGGAGTLFSDDGSRVDVVDGTAFAFPGTLSSRLRSTVLTVDRPPGGAVISRSADARVTLTDEATAPYAECRPLRLVVAPLLTPAIGQVACQPLLGSRAAMLVADSEPLAGLVDSRLRTQHFRHCTGLVAAGVPVVRLAVPWRGADTDLTSLAADLADAVAPAGLRGGHA